MTGERGRFVPCPICHAYVEPEDLEDHLERRHPDVP